MLTQTSNIPNLKDLPFVRIFKEGDYAVAVDEKGQIIVKSTNHAKVFNKVLNEYLQSIDSLACRILCSGTFTFTEDVVLEVDEARIILEGVTYTHRSGMLNNFKIYLSNGSRFGDKYGIYEQSFVSWPFLWLRNCVISVSGNYSGIGAPIAFRATLVFAENVLLVNKANIGTYPFAIFGTSGPPGTPVLWNNVSINDERIGGNGVTLYVWYEGFEWRGGTLSLNVPVDETFDLVKIAGNTFAYIKHIDVYISPNNNGKILAQFRSYVNMRLINVELVKPDLIVGSHITTDYPPNIIHVYVEALRLNEVGPIVLPIIKQQEGVRVHFGPPYYDESIYTIPSTETDGTKDTFKIGTHKVKPDITSDMLDKVAIEVYPLNADALSAFPAYGYLSDDDGDGVYESIYVKFANPPTAGSSPRVKWKVTYVLPLS